MLYKNDVGGFTIKVRQLAAVSFLPTEEVRDAYNICVLETPIPARTSDLSRWWEDKYLLWKSPRRAAGGNTAVITRSPPVFPPSLWNVLALAQNGFTRGHNAVEAWHQRREVLVGGHHVSVFRLIMKRAQAIKFTHPLLRVEDDIDGAIRGQPRRSQSKKQKFRENRLAAALGNRDNVDVLSFLQGIAHNLSV